MPAAVHAVLIAVAIAFVMTAVIGLSVVTP